jgi:hypothetical protein
VVHASVVLHPGSLQSASYRLRDNRELQLLSILQASKEGSLHVGVEDAATMDPGAMTGVVWLPCREPEWLLEDRQVYQAMRCISITMLVYAFTGRTLDVASASSLKKVPVSRSPLVPTPRSARPRAHTVCRAARRFGSS